MQPLPPLTLPCAVDGSTDTFGLGAGIGTEVPVRGLVGKTVQGGTGYTGTITIEGRIFPAVSNAWATLGTVAAGARLAIDGAGLQTLEAIRTNVTTVLGGTSAPSARLAAFNAHAD